MINKIRKYFLIIKWLSIDTCVSGAILFWSIGSHLKYPQLTASTLSFFCAMLLIYLSDHLLDTKRIIQAKNERRAYYQKQKGNISFLLIIVFFIGFFSGFYLSLAVIKTGIYLLIACCIYLVLNRKLAVIGLKEITIAFLFSIAIHLPLFSQNNGGSSQGSFIIIFFIAFINLLLTVMGNEEEDRAHYTTSLVTVFSYQKIFQLTLTLITLLILLIPIFYTFDFFTQPYFNFGMVVFLGYGMLTYFMYLKIRWPTLFFTDYILISSLYFF